MEELLKELLTEIKKLNQTKERVEPKHDFEPVDKTRLVADDAKERSMKQVFMDYMASQNPSQVIAEMSQALDQYEDENNIPDEMELSDVDPTFVREVEDLTQQYKSGKLKKRGGVLKGEYIPAENTLQAQIVSAEEIKKPEEISK